MIGLAAFGDDLYTGRRSYDFVGKRRRWYMIAVVLILVSVLGMWMRGFTLGLEFRGGTEFRVSGAATGSEIAGQDAVQAITGQVPRVSKLNENSYRVQTDDIQEAEANDIRDALARTYRVADDAISVSFVGPTWGADVTRQAITGLLVFLVLVSLVIAIYFRTWAMAASAMVALLHDLVITMGIYALVGFEITPASVIGFLTILGYSLYDTVVVFDKVRENTDHVLTQNKRTFAEAANLAVNQTLVRSVNTSVVALLPVASILFIGAFLLGAGTLKDIALSLFVGIAAGTYSSVFLATPLLVQLREREPAIREHTQKVLKRRAATASGDAELESEVLVGAVPGGSSSASSALLSTLEPGISGADDESDPAPSGSAGSGAKPRSGGQRNQPKRGNRRR